MVYAQIVTFNVVLKFHKKLELIHIVVLSYLGLPPPPPSQSGNVLPPGPSNQLPSGVDPNNKNHELSSGLITVITLASAMGVLLLVGFVWLILLRRSLNEKSPPSVVGPLHAYFNPKPEGVQLIQLRMNAYFNSKPEGVPLHLIQLRHLSVDNFSNSFKPYCCIMRICHLLLF